MGEPTLLCIQGEFCYIRKPVMVSNFEQFKWKHWTAGLQPTRSLELELAYAVPPDRTHHHTESETESPCCSYKTECLATSLFVC